MHLARAQYTMFVYYIVKNSSLIEQNTILHTSQSQLNKLICHRALMGTPLSCQYDAN